MDRQEFCNRLRAALSGRLPAATVEEHMSFYQDYINKEIRKGRSEEDVLAELGDPRLIAKTILETATQPAARSRAEDADRAAGDASAYGFRARMSGRLVAVLCVIILLVVLGVVFSVLSAFLPLILVMAGVVVLVKIFRDWT